MKKTLFIFSILFLSVCLSAQDAYYSSLRIGQKPSDWIMSSFWSEVDEEIVDWDFDEEFAYSFVGADMYAGPSADHPFTFLGTPIFSLNIDDAEGSVGFWCGAMCGEGYSYTISQFFVMAVDYTAQKVYGTEIYEIGSNDYPYGAMVSITFDEFVDEDGEELLLEAEGHDIYFAICHYAQLGGNGAFCVSDFVMRKRQDAYLQLFFPNRDTRVTEAYLVTSSDGVFTAPRNPYPVPDGKRFIAWETYDASGESLMDIAEGQSIAVDDDYMWYASYVDVGENNDNGGNDAGGSGTGGGDNGGTGTGGDGGDNGGSGTGGNDAGGSGTGGGDNGGTGTGGDGGDNGGSGTGGNDAGGSGTGGGDNGGTGTGGDTGGTGGDTGGTGADGGDNGGGTNGVEYVGLDDVVIYPNPVRNRVCVKGVTACRLDLMDLSGRILFSEENALRLDLTGLQGGVYMLRISTSNGTMLRKIIKR